MASGRKNLMEYEIGQLALVKMKKRDKQYWPVEIHSHHENSVLFFKWLYNTTQM